MFGNVEDYIHIVVAHWVASEAQKLVDVGCPLIGFRKYIQKKMNAGAELK